MKLIYLKSALICDSFDVAIDIKLQFFRVLVTIEPGRSLLQFVTTNCLKMWKCICFARRQITGACLFVFCVFFPRGDLIDSGVQECRERAHSNGN